MNDVPDDVPEDDDDNQHFLHEAHHAIQTMFDIFQGANLIVGPRLTDEINIRSWFVHHADHPRWWRPRYLSLEGHWRLWSQDILSGWRDLYQQDQEVDFVLCFPDPPRQPRPQPIHFDLIIIQGVHLPRAAGLITVLRPVGFGFQVDYTLAASLPAQVSGGDLVQCASLGQACQRFGCILQYDEEVLPFTFDPVHDMSDGDTFTIQLRNEPGRASTDLTTSAAMCPNPRVNRPTGEDNIANDEPMMLPPGTSIAPSRPHYEGTFRWIDDLRRHYLADAEVEVHDQAALLYIQTWFIDHQRHGHRQCRNPRTIRIDNHIIHWLNIIRETWHDSLDADRPFDITIVQPSPPQPAWQFFGCHLIVEQGQNPREIAGLVSVLFEGSANDGLLIAATSLPRFVRTNDIIEALSLQPQAENRRCTAWSGSTRFSVAAAVEAKTGLGICLRFHARADFGQRLSERRAFADIVFPEGSQAVEDLPDIRSLSLMQRFATRWRARQRTQQIGGHLSDSITSSLNVDAPVFVPGQAFTFDFTLDFMSEQVASLLHVLDNVQRSLHLNPQNDVLSPETAMRCIQSWFLHFEKSRVCFHMRPVHLLHGSHPEALFREVWQDKLEKTIPLVFHWVDDDHLIGACLDQLSQDKVVLAELIECGSDHSCSSRRAALVPPQIVLADFCPIFGFSTQGHLSPQLACCRLRINAALVESDVPSRVVHGSHLVLQWNQQDIANTAIRVSFEDVVRTHEFLDAHFLLPTFDLPHEFPWWPESLTWIEGQWWQPGIVCSEICIYYDGSRIARPQHVSAGCAIAAFVRTDQGWMFAGAISSALDADTSPYLAELHAAVLAHKFLHDFLKMS